MSSARRTADDHRHPGLDRHGVAYLLVGGAAARLHGAQRLTVDVDVVARRDVENLERLAAALSELRDGDVDGS